MSKKATGSDLTVKQLLFCHEYLVDLNGTNAALRAGYAESGASVEAARLLGNAKIQTKLNALIVARAQKADVSAEKVLTRLDAIGDVDMADCFTETGALKNIHDIPKELRKCIASIEVLEVEEFNHDTRTMEKIGETKKIKFWDKIKANELIGRNLKMFNEKVEHKHTHTLEQLVGGSHDPKDVTPSTQTTPMLGGANDKDPSP